MFTVYCAKIDNYFETSKRIQKKVSALGYDSDVCPHDYLVLERINNDLLPLPSLGFVEDAEVATDLQVVAIKPDGAFVGLAVLGVVDLTALPLLL